MTRVALQVSGLRVTQARPGDVESGLLAYLSFVVAEGLRLDGVALRRTRAGRLRLSFPAKKGSGGREFPFVYPVDDATREAIERQVFAELGLGGEGSR